MIAIKTPERNGKVVNACMVQSSDEVMMITDGGVLIRTPAAGISMQGRNTQGIRVIALSEKERLVTVDRVDEDQSEDALSEQEVSEEEQAVSGAEASAEQAAAVQSVSELEPENKDD